MLRFRLFNVSYYVIYKSIFKQIKNVNLGSYYMHCLNYSSKMNELQSTTLQKNAGDRKFYSLPDEYHTNKKLTSVTEESSTLIEEIYSNILSRKATFNGPYGKKCVIYCDYAASGQSLNFIEDYIRNSVLPYYGNTHTTTTATSLQSTYFRHEAKDLIRKAVNASEHDAIIFTGSGCTGAVNKLIKSLNLKLPAVVFVGPFEHHSNLLPWLEINAKVVRIKETSNGLVDVHNLEEELQKYSGKDHFLIGSFTAASNITGIISDDINISILLHKYRALSFWDFAAAGPYIKIDMNPVIMGDNEGLAYKDAIFLSPHKFVGGPDTPGILIAKKVLFENPIPCEPGGGTVFFVTRDTHRYLKDVEMREEGGTPSIIGAIRAGMVFQLKEAVGIEVINEKEKSILKKALNKWKNIPQLRILGNTSVSRLPIFSFLIHHSKSGLYLHHNFICALLNDLFGIQTRSGCACAGPYALDLLGIDEPLAQQFDNLLAENSSLDRVHLRRKGEYSEREVLRPGFVRLTLPYFMSEEDVDFVINAISVIAVDGWKMLPQYSFNPETGEWKHKSQQSFVNRKWLGSISYKSGVFEVKESKSTGAPPRNSEVLEDAKLQFEKSREIAMKKFTPDQHLIFDSESSNFRWFLLPSEAKQYLLGELNSKVKDSAFNARIEHHDTVDNDGAIILKSVESAAKDENCNTHCMPTPSFKRRRVQESQVDDISLKNIYSFLGGRNLKISINEDMCIAKCKWHAPPTRIFSPFLKAIEEFQMIKDGDKVLVCVSGGKDSLSLLHTIRQYQFYAKKLNKSFTIGAVTIDPKSSLYDPSPLKKYLISLNVPYFYEEQDIVGQATNLEKCTSICSFCSRMKRGRIYACAHQKGYNVIALGQHLDDLAESFFMSIFHNGRLRTMKACYLDETESLRIIRPFVFVREKDLRNFADQKKLPVISENCPACFEAPKERHRIKQLLAAQEVKFPNIFRSLKNALIPLMSFNACGQEDNFLKRNYTSSS